MFSHPYFRSSHRRCSVRKGVLRNFAKFTGKYLCQSFVSKNTLFTEYLRATASVSYDGLELSLTQDLLRIPKNLTGFEPTTTNLLNEHPTI